MFHFRKPPARTPARDNLCNMTAMTEKLGLSVVPAAWPTNVAQLGQAISRCERCDAGQVCADWLARTSKAVAMPPRFCPNERLFAQAKLIKD